MRRSAFQYFSNGDLILNARDDLHRATAVLTHGHVPGFDALVLSHADRTRFLDDAHRGLISTNNGIFHPTVLTDGRICGTWKIVADKNKTSLEIMQFSPVTKRQRIELTEEAVKLLKVVAADAKQHDVLFSPWTQHSNRPDVPATAGGKHPIIQTS